MVKGQVGGEGRGLGHPMVEDFQQGKWESENGDLVWGDTFKYVVGLNGRVVIGVGEIDA